MEGGMSCVKYLMFFFNLLTFLAGAALLGVGIWVVVEADSFRNVISSDPLIFNSVYVIIAVGAALFLIGFLGCCGAVNENRCLLGTFFTLVLILFILQLVGAILAIVYKDYADEVAMRSIKEYSNGKNKDEIGAAWRTFQEGFECCGYNGPQDWGSVPLADIPPGCSNGILPRTNGCKDAIAQLFWVIAGIALAILVVELLAMIFACCLYRSIGDSKSYA